MSALMQTYARLPVTFSHGEGVYLYDTDGKRYLDGISGIAVRLGMRDVARAARFYGDVLGARGIRKHLGWYMDHAGTPSDLRKRVLTGDPVTVRSALPEALGQRIAA